MFTEVSPEIERLLGACVVLRTLGLGCSFAVVDSTIGYRGRPGIG